MRVAVIGLGKIGLPLAVQVAASGHEVIGSDISSAVVESVRRKVPPFPNEAELDQRLAEVVESGALAVTTRTADAVGASEVVLVVVPLVVDEQSRPDFSIMDAATAAIGPALRPGTLVSYETTLPVHTTRGRFVPALEAASGLTCGVDLFVCHSPERVFSGRVFSDLRRYPKLVGGVDEESGRRATSFYASALQFDERPDLGRPNGVWDLGSAEAAELTKLVETTFRDVNIALANEFSEFADRSGLDIRAVIAAANSQPFSHVHAPGIAVGGHCIPVYPRFYLSTDPGALLPAAARAVNESMPVRAVDALESILDRPLAGARVVVLGAAYRGGVKEAAFSGAFTLVREIAARGGEPLVQDPLFDDAELRELGFEPFHLGDACDAAIVQCDHASYRALRPQDLPGVRAVFDGRDVLEAGAWQGVRLKCLGRP